MSPRPTRPIHAPPFPLSCPGRHRHGPHSAGQTHQNQAHTWAREAEGAGGCRQHTPRPSVHTQAWTLHQTLHPHPGLASAHRPGIYTQAQHLAHRGPGHSPGWLQLGTHRRSVDCGSGSLHPRPSPSMALYLGHRGSLRGHAHPRESPVPPAGSLETGRSLPGNSAKYKTVCVEPQRPDPPAPPELLRAAADWLLLGGRHPFRRGCGC